MSRGEYGHVCGEKFDNLYDFQQHARKCARMSPVRTSSREARADEKDGSSTPDSRG